MPEVRLITPITRQSTKKMQVAAYCRVSSNSADQLNSYAAQIRAYKKCIGARDDWELVDIFADEGLTGMKSETRDEFQRMIRMCELKQIDLIITKSISRFARNTKDALAYVRKLKLLGVGVQFEKEGISTLSMGDEMLLNTFSALAQEESQSISMNQRLSIVKRMELGEYVDSNAPYGYRLVDKMLTVYEPEAGIVRNIFALYLQGFSTSEIARELNKLNIPTKAGKEIWRPSRVAYILKNERYIGDSFYQKTYRETTVPFNQHPNRGQEDRFYAKGTHPGIVEKDVFDAAQILIEKRNDDCGIRVRISDTQLIETITVLINRVILNDHLLQPKPRKRYEPDAKVTKVGNDIALELERDAPNEEYIIEKTIEMAALMYEQSNAKLNLTVSLARKLAHTMVTQDEFNRDYFTALASYITLGEQGRVVLHTKTETEVTLDDGSNESS